MIVLLESLNLILHAVYEITYILSLLKKQAIRVIHPPRIPIIINMIIRTLEAIVASYETWEYFSHTGRHTEPQNTSNWLGHVSGGAFASVIFLLVV